MLYDHTVQSSYTNIHYNRTNCIKEKDNHIVMKSQYAQLETESVNQYSTVVYVLK